MNTIHPWLFAALLLLPFLLTGCGGSSGGDLLPGSDSTVPPVASVQTAPLLGRAGTFALMATAKIDGIAGGSVNGNVGLSPAGASSMTLPYGDINGTVYTGADQAAIDARFDLLGAYDDASLKAASVAQMAATDLGGRTLYPGLYRAPTSFDITLGDLTLDAQGNPNAVFVFQMESSLTVAVGRRVLLTGQAKAANVYWQVGSSATINANSIFHGNVMARASITAQGGALVTGRLLAGAGSAGAGAVTFNAATIYLPVP